MRLTFIDPDHRMIAVQLDDGETLGHLVGPINLPMLATVPVDPANFEYDEIVRREYSIDSYVAWTE
jgi:hypothetical protein